MSVETWKEVKVENKETASFSIEDCFGGSEEKYLGDVVSNDGRNMKNIKNRVNNGKGIGQPIPG